MATEARTRADFRPRRDTRVDRGGKRRMTVRTLPLRPGTEVIVANAGL